MIPIRDNVPSRVTPFVNYLVIAVSVLVFVVQWRMHEPGYLSLVEEFGMIPARITQPGEPVELPELERVDGEVQQVGTRPAAEPPIHPWLTIVTCIFLHGGWLHLIGNMWFLYIFGDNVEDRFGHLGYLAFYLVCGVAASVAHLASTPFSNIPTVGASGAVAGIMGAYFLFYPKARILTIIPIFFFLYPVVLPAWVLLGFWFGIQFLQGVVAFVGEAAGVAWWAHVGGFVVGAVIAWLLYQSNVLYPDVSERIPDENRSMRGPRYFSQ